MRIDDTSVQTFDKLKDRPSLILTFRCISAQSGLCVFRIRKQQLDQKSGDALSGEGLARSNALIVARMLSLSSINLRFWASKA